MTDRPSTLNLLWGQVRYQNRIFWRTPISAFFTLVFPLMFLIVFGLVFGAEEISESGLTVAQFYAPALAVFGAVSATYTNLAISTAIARDEGILKRVRGTPLPPWCYIAGRVGSAVYMAGISVGIMLTVGVAFYGLQIYGAAVPALVITFLVGVATFATLGLLMAALAPSGDAAPAIANATLLPLAFFSDIFIVTTDGHPGLDSSIRRRVSVAPLRDGVRRRLRADLCIAAAELARPYPLGGPRSDGAVARRNGGSHAPLLHLGASCRRTPLRTSS